METLKKIFNSAYDLFLSYPVEMRKELVLSFYSHHHHNGKRRIAYQSLTPLALTDEGDLWLVLCTTFFSSRKEPGLYVLHRHNDSEYLEYNLKRRCWYHKEGLLLTREEKEILLLSSQGCTMKEIALAMGGTLDIVKHHKRSLFSKLKVENITEAVLAAINNNLI